MDLLDSHVILRFSFFLNLKMSRRDTFIPVAVDVFRRNTEVFREPLLR